MEITYDYYRVFYYVAKYRSFSKAARVLMSHQPNLSKYMNNLEAQLGCTLLVRSNRGVTLTPEGEKLYAHVAIAYEQLKAAEEELTIDKGLQSGVVTIGVNETALYGILLSVLRSFHMTYPGVRIRLSTHSTLQAIQALKNGVADFAVVTTPTDVHRPLRETSLKSFRDILISGSQYAFLAERPRHLSELSDYPLICLGRDTKTYEFYARFYLQYGLLLKPDTEAATTDQLLPMVKSDLGIAFIPETFAQDALQKGEVVSIPLVDEIPQRAICIVEDTSRHLSIAADALKQMLLSFLGQDNIRNNQKSD